jgi:hypothetical protein
MKIGIILFLFVGAWATNLPIEEIDLSNKTIYNEEVLSRQERGDQNYNSYKWGMLGAACRLATFYGKNFFLVNFEFVIKLQNFFQTLF